MQAKDYESIILSLALDNKVFSQADAAVYLMQLFLNKKPMPSIRELAAVFGWSKSKVSDFVNSDKKRTPFRTLLYMKTKELQSFDGHQNGQKADSKRTRKREPFDKDARNAFGLSLQPFVETYSREMLAAFFNYWGEYDKLGKRMRWEKQATWELALRLNMWYLNNLKRNK